MEIGATTTAKLSSGVKATGHEGIVKSSNRL
jgi:hypothetical protein